jgi:DNA-binding NtrC family response regulator
VVGLQPEAIEALTRYHWPGNVRELMNVIERAVLLSSGSEIGLADLRGAEGWAGFREPPAELQGPPAGNNLLDRPYAEARQALLAGFERRYLTRLLGGSGGRIGEAARLAGLNERSLYALLRRHGLRKEDFKLRGARSR